MRLAPVSLVAALIVTTGLATACSSSLDSTQVEEAIAADLAEQVGGTYTVDCPESIPAEAGNVFTCDVSSADGQAATVQVTQNDADGNVSWEIVATG